MRGVLIGSTCHHVDGFLSSSSIIFIMDAHFQLLNEIDRENLSLQKDHIEQTQSCLEPGCKPFSDLSLGRKLLEIL